MNPSAERAWRRVGRQVGGLGEKASALLREAGEAVGATAIKADVKEAIGSLRVNKQRSILALIGIVVGIGSVTAMVSIGMVAKAETAKRFQELGVEILTVRAARRSATPDAGLGRGARGARGARTIRLSDARAMASELPSIVAATPSFVMFSSLAYAGKPLDSPSIMGVTASFADLNKLSLRSGRFISDLDVNRYYCVLGWQIAQALRRVATGALVGEAVTLAGQLCTVVGVLRRAPGSGQRAFDVNRAVFLPITTGLRTLAGAEIQFVLARRRPDVDHAAAAREVEGYFRRKAGLAVWVQSAERVIQQMQNQMRLFTLLLAVIGSISLIVGGVGVMNVMLASVTERRQEIGIRRALGARRRDIQTQFLVESVILALLGGGLGIALGVAAAYGICAYSGWAFLVSKTAMALGVAMAGAVGVFFGFYPAYQAARLDPIAAMRAK